MSGPDKRVVIITGASRGLGMEIALRFGRAGERVVVNYMNRRPEAEAVSAEIVRSGGDAFPFRADVRLSSDVDALISRTLEQWGRVDILVNNAGLTKDWLCVRMPEQDWDDVIETNLKGPFLCIRAAAKTMMKQRTGHIVNIASIVGMQGRTGQANYTASKAGLIGLTKTAARELGRFNIKVNAVLPGYLPTEMGMGISDLVRDRVVDENALGRISESKEVADFIHHLVSMNNVSGQVFNLDSRMI
jgi:3-oxoacyl-[acyl-carrier protein] reductase